MSPPLPILWLLLAAPGAAEEVMHPAFPLVDREGRDTGDASAMDANRTCGRCHDTAFIVAHSAHHARGLDVDCLRCHVPGGLAGLEESRGEDGWVRLPMAAPASTGCGSCHGVVHPGPSPVVLPADFEVAGAPSASSRTLATGELFSPQRISDSFINLAERDRRDRPWDVHAARGLECVSCHFAANNPARAGLDGGKDGGMDGDNLRRAP
ncbi:MAG: hypothetical protein FJ098_14495, partial [Deltaproteobacteria bacterium]|nr:hypothetical protein [Deltaproteobacteria bacterium]